jgi:hypothetical protein
MPVVACETPQSSALDRGSIAAAYFHDAYRAPLLVPRDSVIDIFFAIFGHHPKWMRLVLIARNAIASVCGLDTPTASEINHVERKAGYGVGDTIGVWPIFHLNDLELVAGRDNKHLDFRLSVLKEAGGTGANVVVSTVCTVHNGFGKLYLFLVVPFHRWGVRHLLSRAIAAGRI